VFTSCLKHPLGNLKNMSFLFVTLSPAKHLLATSEPAPVSLTPRQATISPIMVGSKNSLLSSAEPNLQQHRSHSHILKGISVIAAVIKVHEERFTFYKKQMQFQKLFPIGSITKATNQNP